MEHTYDERGFRTARIEHGAGGVTYTTSYTQYDADGNLEKGQADAERQAGTLQRLER